MVVLVGIYKTLNLPAVVVLVRPLTVVMLKECILPIVVYRV